MLLQLKNIQKRFGGVVALRNGSLDINAGEVHLLMGENGAGKSTLMKIVAGVGETAAGGKAWQEGTAHFLKPAQATARGQPPVPPEAVAGRQPSAPDDNFL